MYFRIRWLEADDVWVLEYQQIDTGPWIRLARAGRCMDGRKQTHDEIKRGMMLAMMDRISMAEVIE